MTQSAIYLEKPSTKHPNFEKGNTFGIGNKGGGRKPDLFMRGIRNSLRSVEAINAIQRILLDPDHDHYPQILKLALEYTRGKAVQRTDVKIDQTINVVYDTKPQRSVQDALRSHESIEAIPVPQLAPIVDPESI